MSEEEPPQSLGAVVLMVMESLSDSVSQLVLLVIAHQEQNTALPPAVPPATEGVVNATRSVTEVARAMSADEYADYPDIGKEINEASDEMDVAGGDLLTAVKFIEVNADRKQGWAGMVAACKKIAGKTIKILQIVYGADLKRILMASENGINLLDKLDPSLVNSDPQLLADSASDTATKLAELAHYVTNKANEEESHVAKEQLQNAAQALNEHSENIINLTNEMLQNPDDESIKKRFDEERERAKQAMTLFVPIIKEKHDQVQTQEKPLLASIEQAGESLDVIGAENLEVAQKGQAVHDAERLLTSLITSVSAGDAPQITGALKSLSFVTDQLQSSEIEQLFPGLVQQARLLVADPNNKQTKSSCLQAISEMQDALDDVASTTTSPKERIADFIERQQATIDTLHEAATEKDPAAVVLALKNIAKVQGKIQYTIGEIPADDLAKAEVESSARDSEGLLQSQVAAAKEFLRNPNSSAQDVLDSSSAALRVPLSAIAAALYPSPHSKVVAADDKISADVAATSAAAKAANFKGVKEASDKLKKDASEKMRLIEAEAKSINDPDLMNEILAQGSSLESLIEKYDAAMTDLGKNPHDPVAQKRVAEIAKKIGEWSEVVTDLVKDVTTAQNALLQGANSGDVVAVKASLDAIHDIANDSIAEARLLAKEIATKDPKTAKEINGAIIRLEEALKNQEEAARYAAAHPGDDEAQRLLKEAAEEVAAALGDVHSLTGEKTWKDRKEKKDKKKRGEDKGEKAAAIQKAERALSSLTSALVKGDVDAVADALQYLIEANEKLQDVVISKNIPDFVGFIANPSAKETRVKCLEGVVAMQDALDLVATATMVPKDRMVQLVCRQEAAVDALNEVAAAKDAAAIVSALKNIAKTQAKIQTLASVVGKEDPASKPSMDSAAKEMESLLQRTVNAAKDLLKDPSNAVAQGELASASASLRVPLSEIEAEIYPSVYTNLDVVDNKVDAAAAAVAVGIKTGNVKASKDASEKLVKSALEKAKLAESESHNVSDPELRKEIVAEVAKLKPLIDQHTSAINDLSKNPQDATAQKRAAETAKLIAEWSDDVTDLLKDSEAAQQALQQASARGDQAAVNAALGAIRDIAEDLIAEAHALANELSSKDPEKSSQINYAISALQEALKQQELAARYAAAHPDDPEAQKVLRAAAEALTTALANVRGLTGDLTRKDRKEKKDKKKGKGVADKQKDSSAEKAAAQRNLEKLIGDLAAALTSGDPKRINDAVEALADILGEIHNPELEKLIRDLVAQAKLVSEKPNDEAAISKANDLIAKVQDAIEAATASVSPKDKLSALVLRQQGAINALEAAIEVQDTTAIASALKNIAKTQAKISALAAEVGKEDPTSKAILDPGSKEAEVVLQKLITAAKDFQQNPSNSSVRTSLESACASLRVPLSAMEAAIHPSPFTKAAAIDDQIHSRSNAIVAAAKAGNVKDVKNTSDKLYDDAKEKAQLASAIAGDVEDPRIREELLSEVAALQSLLDQHSAAVNDVLKDPKDEAAQRHLIDATESISDWTDGVSSLIKDAAAAQKSLQDAAKRGDKIAVQTALDAIRSSAIQAINDARTQAEIAKMGSFPLNSDPTHSLAGLDDAFSAQLAASNEKKLAKATAELENALEKQAEAARYASAHPDDPEAQRVLKEASAAVVASLNNLNEVKEEIMREHRENTKNKSKESKSDSPVHKAIHDVAKAVGVLQDKVAKGDIAGAAEAARNVEAARKKAVEEAQKAAKEGKFSAEDQAVLNQAVDGLNAVEARLLSAAKEALQHNDPAHQAEFSSAAEKVRLALDALDSAVVPPSGSTIESSSKSFHELKPALDDAIKRGDGRKALELARKMGVVATAALAAAYSIADPAHEAGKQILEARSEDLASLLADLATVELELEKDPDSRQRAQKRLGNIIQEIDDAIQRIASDSGAPVSAEAERLSRTAAQLSAEVSSSAPSSARINELAKELADHHKALTETVVKHKANLPPATQEVIKTLLENLDSDLKNALGSTVAVVKDGKSKQKDAVNSLKLLEETASEVARAFIDHPTHIHSSRNVPDEAQVKAADDVSKMLPELLALIEAASRDPSNKEVQERLAAELVTVPIDDLVGGQDPEENLTTEIDLLQDRLAALEDAVEKGDPVKATEGVKDVSQAQALVSAQAKVVAAGTKDDDVKNLVIELADDIQRQIPAMVAAAKEFARDSTQEKTKNKLLKSKDLVAEDAHLLRDVVNPGSNAKVRVAGRKVQDQINELQDAVNKGDKEKVIRLLKGVSLYKFSCEVNKQANKFVEQSQVEQAAFLDPNRRRKIGDAIAELEKRLAEKNGKNDLDSAVSVVSFGDKASFKQKCDIFQKAINDIVASVDLGPHDPAKAASAGLKKLSASSKRADPQGVVKSAKVAATKLTEISKTAGPFAETLSKEKKDTLLASVASVDQLLPQVIVAAKELLSNPNNEDVRLRLDVAVANALVPLAVVEAASSPNPAHAAIEAESTKEASEVLKVVENARKGDTSAVEKELQELEKMHEHLKEKVEHESKNPNLDSASADNLVQSIADVDALLPNFSAAAKDLAENKDVKLTEDKQAKLNNSMINTLDALALLEEAAQSLPLNSSENPEVVAKTQAKIQAKANVKAIIGNVRGGKVDPKKLFDCSKGLASALGSLVNSTKEEAHKARNTGQLTAVAEAALNLDDLLSSLSVAAATEAYVPMDLSALDSLLNSISEIKLEEDEIPEPSPDTSSTPSSAPSSSVSSFARPVKPQAPTTKEPLKVAMPKAGSSRGKPKAPPSRALMQKLSLDESLLMVVSDLQAAIKNSEEDSTTATVRNLANELGRLAAAARTNRRQDVLICGRSIAALVTQICDTLREAAKQSNTPMIQDKLIKGAQSLKNFVIQLKILASVKAASDVSDNDADEQLGSLTRNFGNQMNDALVTFDIHKKTFRAKK